MNFILFILFYSIGFSTISDALTTQERADFLNVHNYLRRAVVPSAADMQELEYDENIEKVVTDYIEQCKFEHRALDGYGENGRLSTDSNITNTVMSWFQERVYFNITAQGDARCAKANSKQEFLDEVQCGHYKMMVRGTLKSLGCGIKFCKYASGVGGNYTDSYITFCFYNAGQMDQPYTVGSACTACTSAYQFCYNDMCVPKNRYSKDLTSCKLKCQYCASYFDPKNSCLCDCPDGVFGNSCKEGAPTIPDQQCSTCRSQGLFCNEGIEESNSGKCSCRCNDQYQGEYCEVRKDHFSASSLHLIDGLPWRYKMMIPVNILEFKKSFQYLQDIIARDVLDYCLNDNGPNSNCKDINKFSLNENKLIMLPGFPLMLDNGTLVLRLAMNYSITMNGLKQERFVDSFIINRVWDSPSNSLVRFIENVRKINPTTLDTVTTSPTKDTSTTKGGNKTPFLKPGLFFILYFNVVLLSLHQ